ncbi:trypsin-like serine protease [Pusillimonas sp. DMV24BSW_D]|uniref:trypsin-like peptidase domain-containing protein n=1 Tax=Neopusillimonas aestuarii TaxID=2716226 RepID=UPI00140D29B2|nr:trypsin-like peptidase domain-containing protein [Pusillimonas sp. DMV24BSW_D]QIM48562.1 trypsin-like serine protease [Pusillimonas sp. DMV24BSW_D]
MRRFWLLFAQTVTVCLGILFIINILRPDWLRVGDTAQRQGSVSNAVPIASYADAVQRASPSVVNIYTSKRVLEPVLPLLDDPELARLFGDLPGFSRSRRATTLGSGVIVSRDGYILTNYHVIESADAIEVALADGRVSKARLIGADPETDLAVLKIEEEALPPIVWADTGAARVGDVVLAIGNPFGVGQTITIGIVSALGRNRLGINMYENFIQTDAAINPGNSGGALIDTQGRLIGINTAIYSETGGSLGIGFAIPAGIVQKVFEDIVKQGFVTRGWIGVEPQDITPDLAQAFSLAAQEGVIVARIVSQSPAAEAGLRVGDIIREINGEAVTNTAGFLSQIARVEPGAQAMLGILRGGKARRIELQVAQRPVRR